MLKDNLQIGRSKYFNDFKNAYGKTPKDYIKSLYENGILKKLEKKS